MLIGGKDMAGLGPNKRPTAIERRKRADELLDMIALTGPGDKFPSELSGGQKQRVAIARALCAEPNVLRLDEPLSTLDLKLRQHMRSELREIQKRVGITFIYITHDQGEALTMSYSVAVMRNGIIDQIGDGHAVYDQPAPPFVGENNVFRGKISAINGDEATISTNRSGELLSKITPAAVGKLSVSDDAMMFVRPEMLQMGEGTAKLTISAKVLKEEFEGNSYRIYLEGEGGKQIKMATPNLGKDPQSQGWHGFV